MKSEIFFAIDATGALFRVNQKCTPMDIDEAFLISICKSSVRKMKSVIPLSLIGATDGNPFGVNLALGSDSVAITMRLTHLPLRSVYASHEDVLTPAFHEQGPLLSMSWAVPETMGLYLGLFGGYRFTDLTQWLVAFDRNSRAYRLPLSNLYDDGKLCGGRIDGASSYNMLETAKAFFSQFQGSNWNRDLYSNPTSEQTEKTRNLFRFKAVGDGFVQLPALKPWEECCTTIANEVVDNYIRP